MSYNFIFNQIKNILSFLFPLLYIPFLWISQNNLTLSLFGKFGSSCKKNDRCSSVIVCVCGPTILINNLFHQSF